MSKEKEQHFEKALDRYFQRFSSTQRLVIELIASRKNPIEILILTCSRLDALASDSTAEGTASKQAFTHFVTAYGGNNDLFNSVSIGDLYYELAYHRWLLEGTIPEPGRLYRFSRVDDPIIQLLDEVGLPLTLEHSKILLSALMGILRQQFRAIPRQSLSKPRVVKASELERSIIEAFQKTPLRGIAGHLPSALKMLLDEKNVCSLLYRRFRCESIHGATILLNEKRFLSETGVYWEPWHSEHYGSFELIEFSAKFLLGCLKNCIKTYRAHLLVKKKIPPDIHFYGFGDDLVEGLEFLDESLLPEGGKVRMRFKR
jgi:hypothetical protein